MLHSHQACSIAQCEANYPPWAEEQRLRTDTEGIQVSKSRSGERSKTGASRANRRGDAPPRRSRRRNRAVIAALLAILLFAGGFYWWQSPSGDAEFMALADRGRAALRQVNTDPSDGTVHLAPGQSYRYRSSFPTSGPHDPRWTQAGFHATPQPATQLVHALEHGNVVIYYDAPAPEAVDTLKRWARLYRGQWDGVVVTSNSGLGEAIVLTAWNKRLRLARFEPQAAAAFVDAYRGRGPENPVR